MEYGVLFVFALAFVLGLIFGASAQDASLKKRIEELEILLSSYRMNNDR